MVCLDTDFLIAYIRGQQAVKIHLGEFIKREEPIHTTMINVAELYWGAFGADYVQEEIAKVEDLLDSLFILNLDRNSAKIAGDIYNKTKSSPIGESDILIASIAMANGQTLLTRNARHFERVHGLKIASW